MQTIKQKGKRICALLCGLGVIFLGTVFCGRGVPMPYNQAVNLSTGQCQGNNAAPVAGEETLALATTTGPNITICILRISDGLLLRHYDLDIHGDIAGQGDGLLFVLQRDGATGDRSALCAIHISDGLTRWCQAQLKDTDLGTIIVNNSHIYLRHGSSPESFATAINEQTGQLLWNVSILPDSDQSDHQFITPGQGVVYINAFPLLTPGTPTSTAAAGSVCALQASNGQTLWCQPLRSSTVTISGMATDEQTLYVETNGTALVALNATDGSLRWQTDLSPSQPTGGYTPVIVTHNTVVCVKAALESGTAAMIGVAVRASDGTQLWSAPQPAAIASMTATDQFLFLATSTGIFSVYNLQDGTQVWSRGAFTSVSRIEKTILIEHGTAYLALNSQSNANSTGYNPYVLAFHVSDGTALWGDQGCASTTLTPPVNATPTNATPTAGPPCSWIYHTPPGYNSLQLQLLQIEK